MLLLLFSGHTPIYARVQHVNAMYVRAIGNVRTTIVMEAVGASTRGAVTRGAATGGGGG